MYKKIISYLFIFFLLQGCIVKKSGNVLPEQAGSAIKQKTFAEMIKADYPDKFSIEQKASFEYKGRSFSTICCLNKDNEKKNMQAVFLAPFGIKLLEFFKNNKFISKSYVFGPLSLYNHKNKFVLLMAECLERIYDFDFTKNKILEFRKIEAHTLISLSEKPFRLEITANSADGRILEKKYFIKNKNIITISYLEYKLINDRLFPVKIEFQHIKSKLKMRIKETVMT